jgi:hypothetical protein
MTLGLVAVAVVIVVAYVALVVAAMVYLPDDLDGPR